MNRLLSLTPRAGVVVALLAVALLPSRAVQADTTYHIQAIARQGDTTGTVKIKPTADFELGSLNDRGQIVFVTESAAGGEMLLLYTDGQLLPIHRGLVWSFVSMNQLGNIVYLPDGPMRLWEYDTRKDTRIPFSGQPAGDNGSAPVINNFGEIAFKARVKNAAGKTQAGIFFLGRDGQLLPVALPDQEMPDGHKIVSAVLPQINDAGSVAFLAQREGEKTWSAYLWDKGPITPLAAIETDTPGGGKFADVYGVWLNNSTRSVVVAAPLTRNGPAGIYRIAAGQVTPLVLPGQELPDGAKLSGLDWISTPNDADQYAVIALDTRGGQAAYVLDPDGKLSLVFKSSTATDLGTVTRLGDAGTSPRSYGIALNNRGQVAFPARIRGGPAAILLLTPAAP